MSPWSARRKLIFSITFFVVAALAFVALFYFFFYEKPTCFDGKKNGDESGIDCGGSCSKVCKADLLPPIVEWSRAFEVSDGVYNVAAYIENPNINAEAKGVPYTFRLFDEENILVYERKGKMDIPRQSFFAIYETNVQTGNRIPRFTFFEFENSPNWKVAPTTERPEDSLRVKTQKFIEEPNLSKLVAVIENTSFLVIRNVELIAILYDSAGNAVAVSRTIVDSIEGEGEQAAVFTWPLQFKDVSRSEIIPSVR